MNMQLKIVFKYIFLYHTTMVIISYIDNSVLSSFLLMFLSNMNHLNVVESL